MLCPLASARVFIITEKMTGTKAHRPELDKLKEHLDNGDTVVVESLSRLGRSTKDLLVHGTASQLFQSLRY